MQGTAQPGQRLRMFSRLRVQLLGGLLLAVWLPSLVRWPGQGLISGGVTSLNYAIIGSLVAVLGGYWVLRQLSAYPGVKATQYIVPTFAVSYAIVIIGFFLLRIDYSRYQFVASYLLAVIWFYAVFFLVRRAIRPRFAVVPFGKTKQLDDSVMADWLRLASPAYPPVPIDGIVADLRADLQPEWQRFLADAALKSIPVYHVKQITEALTGKVEIEHLSENSFGSVLPSLLYLRFKRLLDLALAIVLAPAFLIVIAIAAIAIKLDSTGPVFFRQDRVGFRGDTFSMIKLRTMRTDTAGQGNNFTVDGDPRITRVGWWLRKFRIDEFPQIINIFKGDMSWIGPRPEAQELADWYGAEIPFYSYRHIVRPGITGWAQVNQGNVAEVEAATYKLHYDFYYIKNFSPWLDALIIAKTIRTMLTGFGSR